MPRSVPVFAVLSLCVTAAAGALDCRLEMADGTPLAGARVLVVGRDDSMVADAEGRFVLDPVPDPPFVLFVARPDGVALLPVTVIELPAEGPLTVQVMAAGETVTVISGLVPDLELPPAVAVTVMGRGDLDQRLPTQIVQSLENLPGAGQSGGGHAAVPGIRGMPQHRTLLLLDDGRVVTERRAGASATYIDPETVEEVEVVRGPGSVAYGSDAFGGIIRARTRMPDPRGANDLRFSLIGGTGLDEVGAAAEVTTGLFGGGFLVGASYRDFGDYESPEGTVANSGAELAGWRLGYQAVVAGGILHLGWRVDEARDVGKPAPDSDQRRVSYPEEVSRRLSLGFERPGPGRWTRIGASFSWDSYLLVLEKDRFATATDSRRIKRTETDANDFTLRFDAERSLGEWKMVLGTDITGRYGLEAVNRIMTFNAAGALLESEREQAIESARRTDLGVFATFGRSLRRWRLNAGIRGDAVSTRNSGGFFGDLTTSNSALSGFAAIGVDLGPHLVLTGQVARGFRDPLLSDRYFRGETGRGFITGNPDLVPETSLQFDLALRYASGSSTAGVYAYRYRIFDLIERYRDGDDFFFRNRGKAEITGLEVEIDFDLTDGVELQVGAHYLRGEVVDDRTFTDGAPPPGVFVVLRGRPGSRWWWMARGAAFARDDRPGPTELEVPGYGVLDAGVGFSVSKVLELSLLGRNLLDHSYLASSDEATVLAPGRSLQLVLRGRL
ncbi:MAG: TonB-dependent receptor [Thermoanaerobaculales bacterium]